MGNLVKEIRPSYKMHIVEGLVGLLATLSYFIQPIRDNFLAQANLVGFPLDKAFLVLGPALLIYSIYNYINRDKDALVEVYENGLVIGDFESSFQDLVVRPKSNWLIFSNSKRDLEFKHRLSRADYNYLRDLGR